MQESQEQYRIVITKEANACLEAAAAKVNGDFEAGAVDRTDIAIYFFLNLPRLLTDADIKAIRSLHFNEKKVLSGMLKADSELPEELRRALREHYGLSEKDKKRTLRAAPDTSSERPGDGPSAA
jgi:hypothetical protein